MPKQLIASAFALLVLAGMPALFAGGSVVPVGTYLYADLEKVPDATGSLELRFTTPGPHRLVVACGRKYRKDSKGRDGSDAKPPWTARRFAEAFFNGEPAGKASVVALAVEAGLSQRQANTLLSAAEAQNLIRRQEVEGDRRRVNFVRAE